jgi:soluble lytic murein transglycosylase-like protein
MMRLKILSLLICLTLCTSAALAGPEDLDGLIAKYAVTYNVPETLIRRIIKRESNYDPSAYSRGHWGLMQIKHQTARTMGYRGSAKGLLDAETNLTFGVKYLAGAYLVAGGNETRAVRFYASGYYYDAKRKGLLEETGLGRDRKARRKKVKRLTNVKNSK